MGSSAKAVDNNLWASISPWLSLGLSEKMKFAIKASLSVMIVYLICFSMGWPEARTASITILIIATVGSSQSTSQKAIFRVIDTLVGATIGLILIGLFPQDRLTYLVSVSVAVTILAYLSHAYKGGTRLFMLSALTLLMMFDNGEIDDVFTYGIGRVSMIIFGILIYTLVNTFLWPLKAEENSIENASSMTSMESEFYLQRNDEKEKRKELYQKILSQEALLNRSNLGTSDATGEMGFTTKQWNSIIHNYKKINEILTLIVRNDKMSYKDDFPRYVTNYQLLDDDILTLFEAVSTAWEEGETIDIPTMLEPEYQFKEIHKLSHLDQAALIATIECMQKLYIQLCSLAEKLNSLISPKPTRFILEDIPRRPFFLWFDMEDLKAAFITFLIFWTTVLIWIYFNPPGSVSYGFYIVTFAASLSIVTIYGPTNPLKMIIIFSLSFIFASIAYIFILPHLTNGWEIGLFIFGYSFLGFYYFKEVLTLFFLLGMSTLDILNEMVYSFDIVVGSFFMMYAFLFVLLLFHYIPFSSKEEHLVLILKKRFFKLSKILLIRYHHLSIGKRFTGMLATKYSKIHLRNTVDKMQLWTASIDTKYFDTVDKKLLLDFGKECEEFIYLLKMMHQQDIHIVGNPLLSMYKEKYNEEMLADLLGKLASKEEQKIDPFWSDEKHIIKHMEDNLELMLSQVKYDEYSQKDIIEFYENINLRKNVWLSLFSIHNMMSEIDFKALEGSRF